MALVLAALGLWMAASFLPALIGATILAVALWPPLWHSPSDLWADLPERRLFSSRSIALILVTPIPLAVYEVAQQSDLLVDWPKRAHEGGAPRYQAAFCSRECRCAEA